MTILRPQILLIPILILTILRPGDASWVNDEPIMMEMAIRYNHTASNLYGFNLPFTPCPYGLQGTRGAVYGPLPIWIDQIFLAFTHNLVVMVACRAAVFTALTALAVLWLARTLKLSPWFAVVTMLSPWLWIYSRSLWDSSFCIPISALLLAAYADFLARPNASALRIAVLCGVLLPFIHFMAMAMIAPLAFHIAWLHRPSLRRWKWSLLAILAICLFLFWPYLYYLFEHVRSSHPADSHAWLGWFYPLLGGHFLTLGVAGTMPGDGWQDFAPKILQNLFAIAQWISRAALAAVWLGMILAIPRALQALRRPNAAGVWDQLCLIALSAWICQTLLDGLEGIYFSPHYYGATWLAYVFLAWLAVDWAMSRRVGDTCRGEFPPPPVLRGRVGVGVEGLPSTVERRLAQETPTLTLPLRTGGGEEEGSQNVSRILPRSRRGIVVRTSIAIYAASILLGVCIVASTIARNAGTLSTNYGISLANQIAAANEIQRFSNRGEVEMQVPQWRRYPLALKVLLELTPAPDLPRPTAHLLVKLRNAYPGDAHIELDESGGHSSFR
ncbi:MAG: hypothetical protein ABSB42_19150 [Tepidisphaeraceae bacterium]